MPSGYGFANSLKFTTTTAESAIASDEYVSLWQQIEAQNLQHLAYGTSSAKKVTASFWVKSSITGTFCFGLYKDDSTSQVHNKTYTISSASTWEHKTITFEANTLTGGGINDDNGIGLYATWQLASGSNYDSGSSTSSGWASYTTTNWCEPGTTDAVITTTNATFQLTGVQLEVGPQSTPFEHEPFGVTLSKCQRYTYVIGGSGVTTLGGGTMYNSTAVNIDVNLPVQLRTSPALTTVANGTGNWLSVYVGATGTSSNATPQLGDGVQASIRIYATGAHSGSSPSAAGAAIWCMVLAGAKLIINAEL